MPKGNAPKCSQSQEFFPLDIKSLSLNKLFLFNPPSKKGDIGGFAPGGLEKIPPHPPLQRGENYLRISSKSFQHLDGVKYPHKHLPNTLTPVHSFQIS
jgi:hypothetical protein